MFSCIITFLGGDCVLFSCTVGTEFAGKADNGGDTVIFPADFAGIKDFWPEFLHGLSEFDTGGRGKMGFCDSFSGFCLSSPDKSHAANATSPPIKSKGGTAAKAGATVTAIGGACFVFISDGKWNSIYPANGGRADE